MVYKDFSKDIKEKIEKIKEKVLSGEISLLDIELVSLFDDIKDSLNIYNINKYSMTFTDAFQLLSQKFEELKTFLNFLDNKDKFLTFLKKNPDDLEIYELFDNCWREAFTLNTLSLSFLDYSKDRLINQKIAPLSIESIEKTTFSENFLLEIPDKRFTEKMMSFFETIKKKLPCSYEEIFIEENDQLKIYENFVFLLHLLQLGKLKYQKDTNYLYL